MRPEAVGTDPTAALRISCPIPATGALVIPPRSYTAADADLLKDCAGVKAGTPFAGSSFARTVQAAVDSIKQKAYAAAGIDAALQRVMEDLDRRGGVTWRDTLLDTNPPYGPYAARPCTGSGPRHPLHNGSVPTLRSAASSRPTAGGLRSAARGDPVKSVSPSMRPATSRTAWSTQRGLATEMVATSVRGPGRARSHLYWNTLKIY
jgi:hypothetical protein